MKRRTLTIPIAGFDFKCGALDDDMNEFVRVYKGMLYASSTTLFFIPTLIDVIRLFYSQDSMMHPTTGSLLFRHFWPYIPEWLLRGLVMLPVKQFKRMRHGLYTINRLSQELIEQRKSEKTQSASDAEARGRDLMSILGISLLGRSLPFIMYFSLHISVVRANASENPRHRLTDNEMIAQVATLLLAGACCALLR